MACDSQYFFCRTCFGPVKGSFSMIHDELLPCTSLSDRIRKNMLAKSSKTVPAATSSLTTPGWDIGPSRCVYSGGGCGEGAEGKNLPCE